MNDQHLRIGDAEREQAASDLGEHYALGRLSADEHGERLDQVWAARTLGELAPAFGDLPGHPTAYAAAPRPRPMPWRRGLQGPLGVVLVVLVVLTVLTHLPLVLLGLLAWAFVASRRRHAHARGPTARRRWTSSGV